MRCVNNTRRNKVSQLLITTMESRSRKICIGIHICYRSLHGCFTLNMRHLMHGHETKITTRWGNQTYRSRGRWGDFKTHESSGYSGSFHCLKPINNANSYALPNPLSVFNTRCSILWLQIWVMYPCATQRIDFFHMHIFLRRGVKYYAPIKRYDTLRSKQHSTLQVAHTRPHSSAFFWLFSIPLSEIVPSWEPNWRPPGTDHWDWVPEERHLMKVIDEFTLNVTSGH